MKRPRLKKWAKWVCTLAAVLAVGAAVGSRFCVWDYNTTSDSGGTLWTIGVGSGQALARRSDGWRHVSVSLPRGWRVQRTHDWYWGYLGEESPYGSAWTWHAGILYAPGPTSCAVGASVLYPVALTVFAATLLWYADRRRFGPHTCTKCGYDRRGLSPNANCPECGTIPTT